MVFRGVRMAYAHGDMWDCRGNTEAENNTMFEDEGKDIEVCRVLRNDLQVIRSQMLFFLI